uniref:Methuselah-like protein 5 n=1 Tax=Apis mellifera TaxID=7460 RepID=J7EQB6_APIME|nr:methuselah-like protein 5 [Apis mellifera]
MYYLMSALFIIIGILGSNYPLLANTDEKSNLISVAKCCEHNELLVDDTCTPLTETNETEWRPEFIEEVNDISKNKLIKPNYQLKIGRPKCQSNERQWNVYHYRSGDDRLAILTNGVLRHYTTDLTKEKHEYSNVFGFDATSSIDEDNFETVSIHYDYPFGHYCADKAILSRDRLVAMYAMICVPDVIVTWSDTNYLMKHAIDPTFHAISIISYLIVAVIYFVFPQLHTVMYVSLLAAFFWLNAFGYYVWSTFRSRNVFLRVTDGRKYCYYSTYVWCSTISIAGTAIFAHFTLETNKPIIGGKMYPPQETIGWLGISVLFTSIAFTIIIDLCFVLTTANKIKRMNTYGRIHHKMKYSFRMFVFLFVTMSTGWLSLLLSRLSYEALEYCHIIINLLEAILILYVCVFGQKRVTFLLSKTCNCCNSGENIDGLDWGEEMTAINAGY